MNRKLFWCAHAVRTRRRYTRLLVVFALLGAITLLLSGCDALRGPAGSSVQIQFSADNTNWHDEVQDGDQWIRFRTSDTTPWSAGIRLTGQDGQDGATGAQGPAGPQGPDGQDGATGAQGPAGQNGATGPQGRDGQDGAAGDSVSIQYSPDNITWSGTLTATARYIRFRIGSGAWTIGILFVGASGCDAGEICPTRTTKVASGTTNGPTLVNGERFGGSIANVGNLYNRSGGGTVIAVGADGSETGGHTRGTVHLLSYNSSGTLIGTTEEAHGTFGGLSLREGDLFGSSVANVGNLYNRSGGGTVIAVGATGDDTGGTDSISNRGAIYLLSYNSSGTLNSTTKVTHGTTNGPTLADGDGFGSSIADVGDLDGGGGTVIAVGASGDDTGGNGRGAIYLLSYNSSGTLTGTTKVAHGTTNGPTLRNGDNFGGSIADVGNLYNRSGGGTVIAVGAAGDDTGGNFRGAIYLLSYNSSGTLTGTTKVAHGTTNGPTLRNGYYFGWSIANVGDLDGGGGTVIAVGAAGDDTGGTGSTSDRGAIYLLSYNSSGMLTGTTKVAHRTTNRLILADNDLFGVSIANVGDLDGGGGTVIAVGASADDTGGNGRGAIYLLSYH